MSSNFVLTILSFLTLFFTYKKHMYIEKKLFLYTAGQCMSTSICQYIKSQIAISRNKVYEKLFTSSNFSLSLHSLKKSYDSNELSRAQNSKGKLARHI